MKIGFIGAGRVGVSLGKYFTINGLTLSGYYSRSETSAKEASIFTDSHHYQHIEELIHDSDVLFLTVPDDTVAGIWSKVKHFSIENKIICHCSGVLSSDIFQDIESKKAFGYSIHPLFAVSSKEHSYKEMHTIYFAIEGNEKYLPDIEAFFRKAGNKVIRLSKEHKTKYHAAAALASNYVISVFTFAIDLLKECGFTKEQAADALMPIFLNNANGIKQQGIPSALTGPLERGDVETLKAHIASLNKSQKNLYLALAKQLLPTAQEKNPDRDYTEAQDLLSREL